MFPPPGSINGTEAVQDAEKSGIQRLSSHQERQEEQKAHHRHGQHTTQPNEANPRGRIDTSEERTKEIKRGMEKATGESDKLRGPSPANNRQSVATLRDRTFRHDYDRTRETHRRLGHHRGRGPLLEKDKIPQFLGNSDQGPQHRRIPKCLMPGLPHVLLGLHIGYNGRNKARGKDRRFTPHTVNKIGDGRVCVSHRLLWSTIRQYYDTRVLSSPSKAHCKALMQSLYDPDSKGGWDTDIKPSGKEDWSERFKTMMEAGRTAFHRTICPPDDRRDPWLMGFSEGSMMVYCAAIYARGRTTSGYSARTLMAKCLSSPLDGWWRTRTAPSEPALSMGRKYKGNIFLL